MSLLKNAISCHPERSEGSAFSERTKEKPDSSFASLRGMTSFTSFFTTLLKTEN